MDDKVTRLAYRPREAAEAAGVSVPTIYSWLRMDGFPCARIGGCTVIPVAAFQAWLETQVKKEDIENVRL